MYIPLDWKTAIATPLFKNGALDDLNNYRSISVLPPVSKIFEKLITTRIITYFNMNKLFYNGQYGFRELHSCESALHSLISKMI
jgi:hypothetical protein